MYCGGSNACDRSDPERCVVQLVAYGGSVCRSEWGRLRVRRGVRRMGGKRKGDGSGDNKSERD